MVYQGITVGTMVRERGAVHKLYTHVGAAANLRP